MKAFSVILFLTFMCACRTTYNHKIKFACCDYNDKHKLVMEVPKPIRIKVTEAGGGEGSIQYYYYLDSSVIYISNAFGLATPNDSLIRFDKGIGLKRLLPDTVSFLGIDAKGRHWKEVKYVGVYYGYSNVPTNKIESVENIIRSVRIK